MFTIRSQIGNKNVYCRYCETVNISFFSEMKYNKNIAIFFMYQKVYAMYAKASILENNSKLLT